jgi:hypothetical protein
MNAQKAVGISVVAAVGCLLVVFVAGSLLPGILRIRAAQMEAMKQREIAEAEHQRAIAQKHAAENRVARTDERLDAIQQQLDETRRTWEEAVMQTDGRLTQEDRDRIDRGFDLLQERFKELDATFR